MHFGCGQGLLQRTSLEWAKKQTGLSQLARNRHISVRNLSGHCGQGLTRQAAWQRVRVRGHHNTAWFMVTFAPIALNQHCCHHVDAVPNTQSACALCRRCIAASFPAVNLRLVSTAAAAAAGSALSPLGVQPVLKELQTHQQSGSRQQRTGVGLSGWRTWHQLQVSQLQRDQVPGNEAPLLAQRHAHEAHMHSWEVWAASVSCCLRCGSGGSCLLAGNPASAAAAAAT
jgi:hypothetical protein